MGGGGGNIRGLDEAPRVLRAFLQDRECWGIARLPFAEDDAMMMYYVSLMAFRRPLFEQHLRQMEGDVSLGDALP